MNRRAFISFLSVTLGLGSINFSNAAPKKAVDVRSLVTDVDQSAKTVTVTDMRQQIVTVFTMADPKFYPNEVIINGETKTFADIVKGLQYMCSTEVSPGVVQSITLKDADPAPK